MFMDDLRISELPELSALGDDDYLIIQRRESSQQSYKVKFSDFKTNFLSKFNSIGVGSASKCDAITFAPFAHGHDYSDMWYFSSYGPNSKNSIAANRNPLCCMYDGKFKIVKHLPGLNQKQTYEISAWQPPVKNELCDETVLYAQYKVGDLQLIASKNFNNYLTSYRNYRLVDNNIDITHSSFDGFVIPNGQTFRCSASQFREACQMYAGNPNAMSFTVPNLSNTFFKCDPGLPEYQMKALDTINFHNAMPSHDHNDRLIANANSFSFQINNMQFELRGSNYTGDQYQNCVHHGKPGSTEKSASSYVKERDANGVPTYDVYPAIQTINLTCNIKDIECLEYGQNKESYPDYTSIQALLYIGMP